VGAKRGRLSFRVFFSSFYFKMSDWALWSVIGSWISFGGFNLSPILLSCSHSHSHASLPTSPWLHRPDLHNWWNVVVPEACLSLPVDFVSGWLVLTFSDFNTSRWSSVTPWFCIPSLLFLSGSTERPFERFPSRLTRFPHSHFQVDSQKAR